MFWSATRPTGIARITIDNVERRNCYDPPMRRQMAEYLDDLAVDDDIKVVLLRGAGGIFSTGADMGNAYSWYDPGDPKAEKPRRPSQRRRISVDRRTFGFYHEFMGYPKVTVAEVEGFALGGGFELALMADITVVGPTPRSACPAPACSARPSARSTCSSTGSARCRPDACCSPATS